MNFRLVLISFLSLFPLVSFAQSQRTTIDDQQKISLTVYNNNQALIRDVRNVPLKKGNVQLEFLDVSASIRPETSVLRSLSKQGSLHVSQVFFDNSLLTPQRLLESYIGKTVSVIRTHPTTGVETKETAEVLSARDGVVLKMGNRIETTVPGRIVFDHIPEDMRAMPTLTLVLQNNGGSPQKLELSYLTQGLSWKADYVAELNATDDRLDLDAWITLTNASGTAYRHAQLQLMAGNINQVQGYGSMMRVAAKPAPAQSPSESGNVSQESFGDLRMYAIKEPVTIANNQAKQLALFSAGRVPVRKEWVLSGNQYLYTSSQAEPVRKIPIRMVIEMKNQKSDKLGVPFPAGIVRFYRKDRKDNIQFVGEDRISHTPVNEVIRLSLGDSFDVVADRTQKSFTTLPSTQKYQRIYKVEFEIELRNAKNEGVTVHVREPIPGDWDILSESHVHQKEGRVAVWAVRVPANGKATLTYEALVHYR